MNNEAFPDDIHNARIAHEMRSHDALLGRVVFTWNSLHITLAHIFVTFSNPQNQPMGYAIWHAVLNDRSQRLMLAAAVNSNTEVSENFQCCMKWCFNRIDELGSKRDMTVHSPYTLVLRENSIKVIPQHHTGHNRALNLVDKDLPTELRRIAENIALVSIYAANVTTAEFKPDSMPWPERPRLIP